MVLSEIGTKLSPKLQTAKIATSKMVGSAPSATPAGYKIGSTAKKVPTLVPTPVAKMQVKTKAKETKAAPVTPSSKPTHSNPSTKPLLDSRAPNTPAKINAAMTTTPVLSDRPRMTESENCRRFFASNIPMAKANQPPTRKPEMLALSYTDSQTKTKINTKVGIRAAQGPPYISRRGRSSSR